jgi:hypothetical protein
VYSLKEELDKKGAGQYKNIIVTGAARSGTHLTSKIIERDLGYRYIEEQEFNGNDFNLFKRMVNEQSKCVFQCTQLVGHVLYTEKNFIVMMFRNLYDMFESRIRLGWRPGTISDSEAFMWSKIFNLESGANIPELFPYMVWTAIKLTHPDKENYLEVYYEDLVDDPMFVPKERRIDWKADQTEEYR